MKTNLIQRQNGQVVIETILLMFVSVSLLAFATGKIREYKLLQHLVSAPWERTTGMVESGVWGKAADVRDLHPNTGKRSRVFRPQ